MDLNKLIKRCHQQSKDAGWWTVMDGGDSPNLPEKYSLFFREMYEAYEGFIHHLMDDKLTERQSEETELADVIIRICDYMGYMGYTATSCKGLTYLIKKTELHEETFYNTTNLVISEALESLRVGKTFDEQVNLSIAMHMILEYGKSVEYDIETTIDEKLEFNKNRADHKMENRVKDGGKKF